MSKNTPEDLNHDYFDTPDGRWKFDRLFEDFILIEMEAQRQRERIRRTDEADGYFAPLTEWEED